MCRIAAVFLLISSLAHAVEPAGVVVVLPMDARLAHLDEETRTALDESIRTVSASQLSPRGYTVLTGETTLAVLRDNGIDATKACEASCALEAARELHAKLFVSGTVTKSEGEFVAYVRLFEIQNGRQLAAVQLEGRTVKELRQQFVTQAATLFAGIGDSPAPQAAVLASADLNGLAMLGTGGGTLHLQLSREGAAELGDRRLEAEFIVDGRAQRCPQPITRDRACEAIDAPGLVAWRLYVDGSQDADGTSYLVPGARTEAKIAPGISSIPFWVTGAVGLGMTVAGFAMGSAEGGLGRESAGPVLLVSFGLPLLLTGGGFGAWLSSGPTFGLEGLSPLDTRTSQASTVSLK